MRLQDRAQHMWLAMACHGLPWLAMACHGLPWLAYSLSLSISHSLNRGGNFGKALLRAAWPEPKLTGHNANTSPKPKKPKFLNSSEFSMS